MKSICYYWFLKAKSDSLFVFGTTSLPLSFIKKMFLTLYFTTFYSYTRF